MYQPNVATGHSCIHCSNPGWAAGNRDVELRILPSGNHSFQFDADDYETRVQEKITAQNFARPFDPQYPAVVIDYLARRLA